MRSKYKVRLLTFIMTENCNYRCKYCFVKFDAQSMPWEVVKKAVEWAKKNDIKTVSLFGGEPLLEWGKCKYIIENLAPLGVQFSITTNGSILNEEIMSYIKKYNIGILLSYDGLYQDIYRGTPMHRAETAKKVRENMQWLRREGIKFTIAHQVVPGMLDNLEESVEDAYKYSDWVFLNMVTDSFHIWNDEQIKRLLEILEKLYRRHPNLGPMSRFAQWDNPPNRCGAGRGGIAVGIDGKFYPCQRFALAHLYPMGDVFSGLNEDLKAKIEDRAPDNGIAPCLVGNWERTGSLWEAPEDNVKIFDGIYKISKKEAKERQMRQKEQKPKFIVRKDKDVNAKKDVMQVALTGHFVLRKNGKIIAEGDNNITNYMHELIYRRLKGEVGERLLYLYINPTIDSNNNVTAYDARASYVNVKLDTDKSSGTYGALIYNFQISSDDFTGDINSLAIGTINGKAVSVFALASAVTINSGEYFKVTWLLTTNNTALSAFINTILFLYTDWIKPAYIGGAYDTGEEPDYVRYTRPEAVIYKVSANTDYSNIYLNLRFSMGSNFTGYLRYLRLYFRQKDKNDKYFNDEYIYTFDLGETKAKLQDEQWDLEANLTLSFTSSSSTCTTTCEASCQDTCETDCQENCKSACQEQCELVCQETCKTNCESDCQQNCKDTCEGACQDTCENTCQASCQQNCKTSNEGCTAICESSCKDTCEISCQSACKSSCEGVCEQDCKTACKVSCQSACKDSCQGVCEETCKTACKIDIQSCTTNCEGICEDTCKTACQDSCQSGCKASCESICEQTCKTDCKIITQTCTTNCENICEQTCKLDACQIYIQNCADNCENICEDTCKVNCQTTCQLNCQEACQLQTCQTTCEVNCQQACKSGCQANCEIYCRTAQELGG